MGGDLILDVPEAGSFTFVSLALMGYDGVMPEFLGFNGKVTSLGTVLTNIDEVNSLPLSSVITNEFINMVETIDRDKKLQSDSVPVIVIDNNPDIAENDNISMSLVDYTSQSTNRAADDAAVEYISRNRKTQSSSSTSDNDNTSKVEGIEPTLSFDIDIQHVKIRETTTLEGTAKVLTVYGGGGTSYANIYPEDYTTVDKSRLVAQTSPETIDYSDKKFGSYDKVVIYADDENLFNSTTTSRTIILTPNEPEGFKIDEITLSSNSLPNGFKILNGTQVGNSWILKKDNPDTLDVIEGFTVDNQGRINITFSVDNSQKSNFIFELHAKSEFSMDNVSEENKATIKPPVKTTLEFKKEYAVQVKGIEDETISKEYDFEPFFLNGKEYKNGFVISSNINDTDTKGSQELINTIIGGIVKDKITGGLKNDTIFGNEGNDTIITRAGDDTVDGGADSDTLDYSEIDNNSNIGIDANLTTGKVTYNLDNVEKVDPTKTFTDTISNIENIIATQDKDILKGNELDNTLKGEGSSDTIYGMDGSDLLEGGAGDDTIDGGAGDDRLKGGAGKDTVSYIDAVNSTSQDGVVVNLSSDSDDATKGSASGIAGDDELWEFENIIGSNYNDTLIGNNLDNTISGEKGDDTLAGGAGNDTLIGGEANEFKGDTVDYSKATAAQSVYLNLGESSGGDGNDTLKEIENVIGTNFADTIHGDDEANILDGGRGDDSIDGAAGNDTIYGRSGKDKLSGGAGDDTIDGGIDDDTLSGGAGDDILKGDLGNDYVDYSELVNSDPNDKLGVEVDLSKTVQQDTKKAGLDTLENIENLIGSRYQDTLKGSDIDNTILAGNENDTIIASGSSALGYDYIDGESGDRDLLTYEFSNQTNRITVDLSKTDKQNTGYGNILIKGVEDVTGSKGSDLLTGDESSNILKGLEGGDTLRGNGGADTIYGGADNDLLEGGTGDDLLEGEEGNDTLRGGEGNDSLVGGNGIDTADYSLEDGKLNVTLGNDGNDSEAFIGNKDKDVLNSIENIIGTRFDDTITGNNQENSIDAGAGNDILDGGNDNVVDTLFGGVGNDKFILRVDSGVDVIDGGNDSDTVDYSSLTNTQKLNLKLSSTTQTQAVITEGTLEYKDSIENIENIISGSGDDTLEGSDLDNTIEAKAGNDTLIGGRGNDYLDGGDGSDKFTLDFSKVASFTINGGAGDDTVVVTGSTSTISSDTNLFASDRFSDIKTLDLRSLNLNVGNDTSNSGTKAEFTITDSLINSWSSSNSLKLTLKSSDASKFEFTDNTGKKYGGDDAGHSAITSTTYNLDNGATLEIELV